MVGDTRSAWENLLGTYGYQCFSEGTGFAQFHGKGGWPRIDIMLVDAATFSKLVAEARETQGVHTPSPRHMVALKLHAASSHERDPAKAAQDWQDIRKLIEIHNLDLSEASFTDLIRKHGGEQALDHIRRLCHN